MNNSFLCFTLQGHPREDLRRFKRFHSGAQFGREGGKLRLGELASILQVRHESRVHLALLVEETRLIRNRVHQILTRLILIVQHGETVHRGLVPAEIIGKLVLLVEAASQLVVGLEAGVEGVQVLVSSVQEIVLGVLVGEKVVPQVVP